MGGLWGALQKCFLGGLCLGVGGSNPEKHWAGCVWGVVGEVLCGGVVWGGCGAEKHCRSAFGVVWGGCVGGLWGRVVGGCGGG